MNPVVYRLATNTKDGLSYCKDIRMFAMGLHFHSPAGYEYARSHLSSGNDLPSSDTIARWYQCVESGPGISSSALKIVKTKVDEAELSHKPLFANLVMDEMALRKQLFTERDGSFGGLVDMGFDIGAKQVLANEALTFLVTAINDHFKVAVSYHLSAGLTAEQKVIIVTQVLMALNDTKVKIPSFTFDGTRANLRCMELMGAVLEEHGMNTIIPHPCGVGRICIIMDAVHMFKLVRNTFASKKILKDDRGRIIDYQYLVLLEQFQREKGLHIGNKLRKRHIDFTKSKMKSKLALQLLSNSVADSLEYLAEQNLIEFQGVQATVDFIRTFNNLFDILNSKSKFGKEFKRPYCSESHPEFFQYLQYCKRYICQLTVNVDGEQKFVLDTLKKTGFLGFLVDIESVIELYFEYIYPARGPLQYLLTFKLSQDHLEQTFSLFRGRGGFNDNPTTKQFGFAFRGLLVNRQLKLSNQGNTTPQDATEFAILSIASTKEARNLTENCEIEDWIMEDVELQSLDAVDIDIVVYIAGFVENKLIKSIKCNNCLEYLTGDDLHYSALLEKKRHGRGGLNTPQRSVSQVCRIAEQVIRAEREKIETYQVSPMKLQNLILRLIIQQKPALFTELEEHSGEDESHKLILLKLTIRLYLIIRSHHMCKEITEKNRKERIRQFSKKLVIFSGQ